MTIAILEGGTSNAEVLPLYHKLPAPKSPHEAPINLKTLSGPLTTKLLHLHHHCKQTCTRSTQVGMSTPATAETSALPPPSHSSQSPLLSALHRDGYVVIPSLLPAHRLSPLRNASAHLAALSRSAQWPHIRTVPKQFPPWPSSPPPYTEGGIWGVQHLLHPSCPGRAEFARLYFSDEVLDPVKELLGLNAGTKGDEGLVMELFNLLVSPTGGKAFALRWHRDDIDISKEELSAGEEERLIEEASPGGRQMHAQYNIALYEDSSLVVVPGSHRRARTSGERMVGPYEEDMPGAKVVRLGEGDAVFYDSNILHRGVYRGIKGDGSAVEVQRYTLHGSVGLKEEGQDRGDGDGTVDGRKARARARVVLQHGVGEWAGSQGFERYFGEGSERVEERAEGMRKRLVEMGRGEAVGFSLEG
jgi:hypothetical protein